MCGIAGLWAHTNVDALLDGTLRRMGDVLAHRGPDDAGEWRDDTSRVGLVHRRLSILDLSPAGRQPMISKTGRYVVVFNGEIYNHLELRQELLQSEKQPDFAWRGHSDTETMLACFEAWGVQGTLERLVGMFAIALWDRLERHLYLARDRFGEKPLYYGWTKGAFIFGSELKALRRFPGFDNAVDRDVVALYLQFCYVPAPYSIFQNIYKLEPGCLLTLTEEGIYTSLGQARFAPVHQPGLAIERYWSLPEVARAGLANPLGNEREALEELEATLGKAVSLQSIADVPLGAFLSGGVDSSTIVALMQAQSSRRVRTFTIGFEEAGFNEAEHAKAVARHLGTDHAELYVSTQQTRDVIPQLPTLYCEPFADSSQIPTYLVSQMARQHVTVALSGDAGDELFGGYNRYFLGDRIWRRVGWLPAPLRRALGRCIHAVPVTGWDAMGGFLPRSLRVVRLGDKAHKLARRLKSVNNLDDLYRSLVMEWSVTSEIVPGVRPLPTHLDDTGATAGGSEAEQRMMLWDALTYLPDDILCKVDRAAMGVSLETRVPFLDHRVVELAWRLPLRMKIRDGHGKWALRQILYRHVPQELIERPKAGFAIPIGQWLRGPLREWAEDLLAFDRMRQDGLLDAVQVREVWKQHLAGTHDWTPRLWAVLMLQAWLETR